MASRKLIVCVMFVALSGLAAANPASKPSFWKGTPMDGMVEEMRSSCADGNDALSCMKFKVINFLDTIFKKDNFQLTDDVEVRQNGYVSSENTARSQNTFLDTVEQYIQSHDVTFTVPAADAKVTVSPRNINDDELALKIKFSDAEARGKKSKLKKIFIPILVFVLLKAMTLIPLALGVLGIKAWNALQLSFFSFVISTALAVFQFCKKIAADNHHPQIAAHGPWDHGRSFAAEPAPSVDAQNLAYNAYA